MRVVLLFDIRGGLMFRKLRGALLVAFVAGTVVSAARGWAQGDGKCKLATKGDSPIVKACTDGGIKAAKKAMKELTKKAKAAGEKFDCDDCHKDDAAYDQLT